MKRVQIYRVILAGAIVFAGLTGLTAQNRLDSLSNIDRDSLSIQAKALFAESDTVMSTLLNRIAFVNLRVNRITNLLKRSLDTFDISAELPDVLDNIAIVRENLELNRATPNLQNLNISQVMLLQLDQKLDEWQTRLSRYSDRLVQTDNELFQFYRDTILRRLPNDSTLRQLYLQQILMLAPKLINARKLNQSALSALGNLQNRVIRESLIVEEMYEEVNYLNRRGHYALTKRDVANFWYPDSTDATSKPFSETVQLSVNRNIHVLQWYLRQHWAGLLLVLLIFIAFALWLKYVIARIRRRDDNVAFIFSHAQFAASHPLISAGVVAFSIAPLLSSGQPMIYIEFWWVLLLLTIGILVHSRWPRPLFVSWLVFFILYLAYGFINLLVENSYVENRLLFVGSVVSMCLGIAGLYLISRVRYAYPPFFKILTYGFVVAHMLALLLMFLGRMALAKIIATSAMFNYMLAINLYIFAEIQTETLYLQMESTGSNNAWRALFDLKDAQKQFRATFWWAAIFFWCLALLKNLTFLDVVRADFQVFFSKERSIGDTSFTFGGIGLFILIIWVTNLLARLLVSFFGGVNRQFVGASKSKLGTSMLLVRLGVLASGFLLAVAASGIPLDKVTIVLGALGVGIGFGLQNIVNNLVSGIILAFEKPIQVGDIIEVDTRTGIVKEIGIRASKLSTYDGSDVIIPNGDLLSNHLINWTMSNRSRRIEVIFGVAYGSDLEKVKTIIQQALHDEKEILSYPAPMVLVDSLADNSVNMRVLCWAADIDFFLRSRSNVLAAVHNALKEAGIEIPFPQRDLHIRSMPAALAEDIQQQNKKSGPSSTEGEESAEVVS